MARSMIMEILDRSALYLPFEPGVTLNFILSIFSLTLLGRRAAILGAYLIGEDSSNHNNTNSANNGTNRTVEPGQQDGEWCNWQLITFSGSNGISAGRGMSKRLICRKSRVLKLTAFFNVFYRYHE